MPDRPWAVSPQLPIGLGCKTFGRTTDEARSGQVLDAFGDAGGALVDTADTYSDGESERIIGRWMRAPGNRHRMVISTKVGNRPDFDGLSAESVTGGLEASLPVGNRVHRRLLRPV